MATSSSTEPGADGFQTIVAFAPTAELTRYAVDLRAITGGRGRFRSAHDHYDPAPEHLVAGLTRRPY